MFQGASVSSALWIVECSRVTEQTRRTLKPGFKLVESKFQKSSTFFRSLKKGKMGVGDCRVAQERARGGQGKRARRKTELGGEERKIHLAHLKETQMQGLFNYVCFMLLFLLPVNLTQLRPELQLSLRFLLGQVLLSAGLWVITTSVQVDQLKQSPMLVENGDWELFM